MSTTDDARMQTEVDLSAYRCPTTGARLERRGETLRAGQDGPEYPLDHGIPRFLRFGPAEDPATRALLARLLEVAARDGWRPALEEAYADDPGQVRYNTDPDRLKILDLLPLTDRSAVLEIGPALGHMTVGLARRAAAVYALEVVPEQAEFAAMRCRQEGLANVNVACGGDDCRLPYADGLFDVVLLNLVFEWCATRLADEPFLDGQRRLLAEIFRVLKPGGRVLLTTKNRFALSYLTGGGDEHVGGMRFGNALPRWLLGMLLRRRGRSRPDGLLHSHDRLRGLMEQAGFVHLHSYWAAPEMRIPREYVPTDAASIRAARRRPGFLQGDTRRTRLLMPLVPAALVKHLTRGLTFIAEKPA